MVMARQTGLFNFEGTLDNVTFYKTADGLLVRKKGGVSRERMLKDPNFIRARENAAEFGNCAKSAAKLRAALSFLVHCAKDSKLSSRLIKVFLEVKTLDSVNTRGKRTVAQGLTTSMGKAKLKDFDFNRNAKWHSILPVPYSLDVVTGTVTITDFIPLDHLTFPNGATHFSLQCAYTHVDLDSGVFETSYSALVTYPISNDVVGPVLMPSGLPTVLGAKFYVVFIAFFQEVNGRQERFYNGLHNALRIIEVL